jgi:hypothetical protein
VEGILRQSADVDDVDQRVKEYEEGLHTQQIVFEECHRILAILLFLGTKEQSWIEMLLFELHFFFLFRAEPIYPR